MLTASARHTQREARAGIVNRAEIAEWPRDQKGSFVGGISVTEAERLKKEIVELSGEDAAVMGCRWNDE